MLKLSPLLKGIASWCSTSLNENFSSFQNFIGSGVERSVQIIWVSLHFFQMSSTCLSDTPSQKGNREAQLLPLLQASFHNITLIRQVKGG